jgi:TPR repeat protein
MRLQKMKHYFLTGALLMAVALPVSANDVWTTLFNENLSDAETDDADAQFEVGIMYLKGQGVKADRGKAVEWLQASADNGNELAVSKMSRMKKNVQVFQARSKNAERGDANAQYETGRMLFGGKGTTIDAQQAVNWLQKAVNQGHKKAATRLGIIYYKGNGVPANPGRAVELFKSVAASQVLAQYYMGEAYADGRGIAQDFHAAIDWYQQSDSNGYKRAGGKIINIEEEIKMQERREARLSRELNESQLAKEEERARLARVEKEALDAEADKLARLQVAERKRQQKVKAGKKLAAAIKSQPARKKSAKQPMDVKYLARKNWASKNKAINFLPSELNQCEQEDDKLVCYSHKIQESSAGRQIKYRVKSIIRQGKAADSFQVMYRNLVLDVVLQEQDEANAAYGDEQEQGFKAKTGWSKQHLVACKFDSSAKISCLKDGVHRVKVVIANGGRDRDLNQFAYK